MAHQDSHEYTSDQQYNASQWELVCTQCFNSKSSTRPPIYNPENCSCIDLGGLTLDDHPHSPPSPYIQQSYDAGTNYTYYPTAQSYASSNLGSINCPEGPEREDPTDENYANGANTYNNAGGFRPLPLCPSLGLNEERHRRFSSSANEMSYQLHRFLNTDQDVYTPHSIPPTPSASQTQYLSQDMYIQSQKVDKQGCGSKRSYRSKSSGRGGGSGESGGVGFGAEMCGMGAWDEGADEGSYALAMSGLTEFSG